MVLTILLTALALLAAAFILVLARAALRRGTGAPRPEAISPPGSDWTWTVEGRWAPIRDIAFRANYTRAIRAPAITEIFNPSSITPSCSLEISLISGSNASTP